jgi:hypothetical protein
MSLSVSIMPVEDGCTPPVHSLPEPQASKVHAMQVDTRQPGLGQTPVQSTWTSEMAMTCSAPAVTNTPPTAA